MRAGAARAALLALMLVVGGRAAFAQSEPPLSIPPTPQLPPPGEAIPIEGWLLFPTIKTYSILSDNLFQSPTAPLAVAGVGVTPALTAEWTNGIHTTTLTGNFDRQVYPSDNQINTFDHQVSATQRYDPLPDLSFHATVDYTHKTISSGLQNAIPGLPSTNQSVVLPNGDTLLPNGTIVSPSGQVVGHESPFAGANGTSTVNPYDQYTGTFGFDKIFNRAILSLTAAVMRTNYVNTDAQDFSTQSLTGSTGVWLGPLFYAFSDGSVAKNSGTIQSPGATTSYQVRGGIGTRQFGLFRASAYYGHQGSQSSNGNAGGEIYGASLSYYPTPPWTLTASADETVNMASQSFVSQLALTTPGLTPLQIPLGSSTRITATTLTSQYNIDPQWTTSEHFGFTTIQYINSTRLDDTFFADATLTYNIWRNMTLSWEYQYNQIKSNAPLTSTKRNYGIMSALYKF